MSEHVHGCLTCMPDMVPDFDRDDPRYHDGEKCVHRITKVLVDGVEIGYTKGIFEGPEGWALFVGKDASEVHHCSCFNRDTLQGMVCLEPRFGVVTVEHAPPVMIDAAEVLHRLPKGWPYGPNSTTFASDYEQLFLWLHKEAR